MRGFATRHRSAVLPLAILGALAIATFALPLYGARAFDAFDGYNGLQAVAGPGLLALGLGLTMIAGEFDLSTLGMYALGGMVAVRTGTDAPVLGVLLACAVGVGFGSLQGYVIARTGINSMALTLGGYIALIGLTGVLGSDDTVTYANQDVPVWVDQTLFSVASPRSLVTVGAFVLVGLVLWRTRLGRDLRAIGGDRRASESAGVPATSMLTLAFAASGMFSALGGALLAYSSATATSTIPLAPLIFAVTAILIGGVSLSGGHGGALGIGAGVLALGLLNQIFAIQATPSYVADIVLGGLLGIAVMVDAPDMARTRRRIVARLSTKPSSTPSEGPQA